MPLPTTMVKLKSICKVHYITGFSGKIKSDLVKLTNATYKEYVTSGIETLEKLANNSK